MNSSTPPHFSYPLALQELSRTSAQLGRNFQLTQAAGGNTSIKHEGTLWVKASGKWLMHAEREQLFTPVALEGVRRRISADEADPVTPEVRHDLNESKLRPSIETTLHALLPQPAVFHAHSVAGLAWSVRADAQQRITEHLSGLRWVWIPYVRPGLPLTRAVAGALAKAHAEARRGQAEINVLILGNHGIVVGADTPTAAYALLNAVAERLDSPARCGSAPQLQRLESAAAGTSYRLPEGTVCHGLGTDTHARRIAAGGAMYPDHVVFLGGGLAVIDPALGDVTTQLRAVPQQPAVIVAGMGVLVHESLGIAGEAMLQCLAEVTLRVDARAEVHYLPHDEVMGLQNWDAEKFRKQQPVKG